MKNLCLAVILLITYAGCKKAVEANPTSGDYLKITVPYKTITGVNPVLLSLDIYYFGPAAHTKPVVIYVHGGGWRTGNKSNQLENKLNLFHALGYVFISINYRLSPDPSELNNPDRIKFPVHNNDVASAIKWVSDNIQTYNGDASKIALIGHSAGAHLVALSTTSPVFLPGEGLLLNSIKGVACIDTEGYDVSDQMNTGSAAQKDIYENAFGNNPADWNNASPIAQLVTGKNYPSFFIAKRGAADRIAIADAFINKLKFAGVNVSQVNGSRYDHDGINDAIGAPGEITITQPLTFFLQQCFQN